MARARVLGEGTFSSLSSSSSLEGEWTELKMMYVDVSRLHLRKSDL